MLIYKSKFRVGIVILRIFLSCIAIVFILSGLLISLTMIFSATPDAGAMAFCIGILTFGVLVFKISGWNIRQYVIYDDRLDVKILGGVRTISYPRSSLKGFNDLNVLVLNRSGGIGIITDKNKMIKVLELEVREFPEFIDHLQKLIPWDLNMKFQTLGGYS